MADLAAELAAVAAAQLAWVGLTVAGRESYPRQHVTYRYEAGTLVGDPVSVTATWPMPDGAAFAPSRDGDAVWYGPLEPEEPIRNGDLVAIYPRFEVNV